MIKVIHRINKKSELKKIPMELGVEIDVRTDGRKLILSHEPFRNGKLFSEYLRVYNHKFLIVDVKTEWIGQKVLDTLKKHKISDYLILGLSVPESVSLMKKGETKIAVRMSEYESIDTPLAFKGKFDWLWLDVFTKFPLDKKGFGRLRKAGYKICLVSPDRWGRPEDIQKYQGIMKRNGIKIDAVMVGKDYAELW